MSRCPHSNQKGQDNNDTWIDEAIGARADPETGQIEQQPL